MSESELRDLLHRVVPEPPVPDPAGLAVAGRMARRRRRGTVAATVAAVAVAATVVTALVLPGRTAGGPVPTTASATDDRLTGLRPFDPAPCLETERGAENFVLPDLDDVVSVRLCDDLDRARMFVDPPSASEGESRAPRDAVVTGLAAMADDVRADPVRVPDNCQLLDYVGGAALTFELADGSRISLPADPCVDLDLQGQRVDGGILADAVRTALDRQRSAYRYSVQIDTPLTCGALTTDAPVKPDREVLVDAVTCTSYRAPPSTPAASAPLTASALGKLQAAWADAATRSTDGDSCPSSGPYPAGVIARTNLGDVVWLRSNTCGELLLDSVLSRDTSVLSIGLESLE